MLAITAQANGVPRPPPTLECGRNVFVEVPVAVVMLARACEPRPSADTRIRTQRPYRNVGSRRLSSHAALFLVERVQCRPPAPHLPCIHFFSLAVMPCHGASLIRCARTCVNHCSALFGLHGLVLGDSRLKTSLIGFALRIALRTLRRLGSPPRLWQVARLVMARFARTILATRSVWPDLAPPLWGS